MENNNVLKKACSYLAYTILILGSFGSFYLASAVSKETVTFKYYSSYSYEKMNWTVYASTLFTSLCSVFFIFLILISISKIISNQEKIYKKLDPENTLDSIKE